MGEEAMSKFYHKDGTTSSECYPSKALHRTDGPAIEFADGGKEWWVNGSQPISLTKQLLINYMKLNNLTLAHLLTDPDDMLRKSAEREVG